MNCKLGHFGILHWTFHISDKRLAAFKKLAARMEACSAL